MSGCVALSGLGDLEVGDAPDGAVASGSSGTTGIPLGVDGSTPDAGASDRSAPLPFDAGLPFPLDGGLVPDANQPDTGGPEAGPAGAGVVACSATLDCTDAKPVCCFSPFFPVPSCAKSIGQCTDGFGFACDDNSDCSAVCCVTWAPFEYTATSRCMDSCPTQKGVTGNQGAACASNDQCAPDETCTHVASAPGPIKACQ
jgi:hypothetical protein